METRSTTRNAGSETAAYAMNIIIRDERPGEADAIADLTTAAFKDMPMASGTEAALVGSLREVGALIVSLVAEKDGEIVGHIAFSPATLDGADNWYGLGPVSVRPDLHGRGIGSRLVNAGLDRLRALGAVGCVTIGHPTYYPRFGFAANPGLTWNGEAGTHIMALSFAERAPSGEMVFHPAFADA